MKVAIVTWLDAHCSEGELTYHDAQAVKPIRTESVGFLVASTPEGVTIATDHFPDPGGTFKHWHHIPADMLVHVAYLSEVPEPMTVELVDDD